MLSWRFRHSRTLTRLNRCFSLRNYGGAVTAGEVPDSAVVVADHLGSELVDVPTDIASGVVVSAVCAQ